MITGPFNFGGNRFENSAEVMGHLRSTWKRYPNGETVTEPKALCFMRDLLRLDANEGDRAAAKGTRFFFRVPAEDSRPWSFWIRSPRGAQELEIKPDFSRVLSVNLATLHQLALPRCREFMLQHGIVSRKQTVSCFFTGCEIPLREAVIDRHPRSFSVLSREFFQARGVDIGKELLTLSDAGGRTHWITESFPEEFRAHESTFTLRLVHITRTSDRMAAQDAENRRSFRWPEPRPFAGTALA